LTPNQTVKLHVRPEVSALDFANALTISGFTIPAISTRRVETDVELSPGQSFVIAGLLDRTVTEGFQKMPWLASVPLLGNIFKSHDIRRNNSDLLVLVTPELPSPLAPGEKQPEVPFVVPFMPGDYNPLSNGRAAKP
jgi:pilus assembly protein CpaC